MNPIFHRFFAVCLLGAGAAWSSSLLAQEHGDPAQPSAPAHQGEPPPHVPAGVTAVRDIEFAKAGPVSLMMDLYIPAQATQPLPLVVFIYGGGWMNGSKNNCPPTTINVVTRGYVLACIEYRHSSEATFPGQIEDCKAAIRFLRANAGKHFIDPNRIAVWGVSSGAHLACLLGVTEGVKELEGTLGDHLKESSRVQAVVDCCGPADLQLFLASASPAKWSAQLLLGGGGGVTDAVRQLGVKASPVTYAGKNAPPFLIVHGDKDAIVPMDQSESMYKALHDAGASDVTLHVAKGLGHQPPVGESVDVIYGFLDKRLKEN